MDTAIPIQGILAMVEGVGQPADTAGRSHTMWACSASRRIKSIAARRLIHAQTTEQASVRSYDPLMTFRKNGKTYMISTLVERMHREVQS